MDELKLKIKKEVYAFLTECKNDKYFTAEDIVLYINRKLPGENILKIEERVNVLINQLYDKGFLYKDQLLYTISK